MLHVLIHFICVLFMQSLTFSQLCTCSGNGLKSFSSSLSSPVVSHKVMEETLDLAAVLNDLINFSKKLSSQQTLEEFCLSFITVKCQLLLF